MHSKQVAVWALASIAWAEAGSQCPGGTPPPCRTTTVASARRVNPPLDPRTWIVVPFDNVARAADVEWMRAASVNLLYLDLSRWQDIRVIDDERVADYMREVSGGGGSSAAPLSLNAGLSIARRAGAGKLVMGDLLKTGTRLSIVAKVFDVQTAQRIRSPRGETSSADSVMPVFSRLARQILNVEPPAGVTLGEVGTTSIAAYQHYLDGVRLLNSFDLEGAADRFTKALAIDSTFALAHFKLALAVLWRSSADARGPEHANAAVRFSAKLPARERALIKGFSYFPTGDFGAMCAAYAPLVKADSTDVDALGGMADCLYHDAVVIPDPADSTRGQFRSSLNESLRLFRLALKVDPTYLLAYQHLVDTYTQLARVTRTTTRGATDPSVAFAAPYDRSGDTLLLLPRLVRRGTPASDSLVALPEHLQSHLVNLAVVDTLVREWVMAAPTESRAQLAAARVAALRGDLQGARDHFMRVTGAISPRDSQSLAFERFDVLLRSYDMPGVMKWLDSTLADPSPAAKALLTQIGLVFGRPGGIDSLIRATRATQPGAVPYYLVVRRLYSGQAIDSGEVEAAERAYSSASESRSPGSGLRAIQATLAVGSRVSRTVWPALDTVPANIYYRPAAALAHHDTARLRQAARDLDAVTRFAIRWMVSDTGAYVVAADAYLALGDSAAALRALRRGLDTLSVVTSLFGVVQPYTFGSAFLVPRAMLLRADLAAALGYRAEANLWYRRLDALWAKAEPEFDSLRARVRQGIASTRSPGG